MDARVTFELHWSKAYAIGHPAIDQQHAKLFELYNLIAEAFAGGVGYRQVEPALTELVRYTRYHFREEERLMERLGYADIAAHRQEHQRLIAEVSALAADFRNGQPVLLYEILSLLKHWLTEHILTEDLKLKPLMAEW